MPELKKNKFLGMNQDILPDNDNFPQGHYYYALNTVLTDKLDSITNEMGNYLYAETGLKVIGTIKVQEHIVVFCTNNAETVSQIGVIYNQRYVAVSDPLGVINQLDFRLAYPITGEYQFNSKGECILAFRSANFEPRVINIGSLNSPILTDSNDINDTLMFPNMVLSNIGTTLVDSGGSLRTGIVYITYRYRGDDDTITASGNISNPVSVNDDITSLGYVNVDGEDFNLGSPKSIAIGFTNLDTRFKFIELIAIIKLNGATSARRFATLEVNSTTLNTVFTGNEFFQELSLDEVLIRPANYNRIKAITQLNNRLYAGNVEESLPIEYQEYANNIVINYTSSLKNILTFPDSQKLNQQRGFQHGEVYCFYIVWRLNNGGYSRAFHIPGRLPYNNETNADISTDVTDVKVFEINDTCNALGNPMTNNAGTFTPDNTAISNMGYWQNRNEFYPSEGNFPIGNVRHHRFPTMAFTKGRYYTSVNEYGVSALDMLGIIASNVVVPPEIADLVQGYEILYAKRDYNNSLWLSQSTMNNLARPIDDYTEYKKYTVNNGGNWNVYHTGRFNATVPTSTMLANNYSFISQNLALDKPELFNCYFRVEYILQRNTNTIITKTNAESTSFVVDLTEQSQAQLYGGSYKTGNISESVSVPNKTVTLFGDNRPLENFIGVGYNFIKAGTFILNPSSFGFIQTDNIAGGAGVGKGVLNVNLNYQIPLVTLYRNYKDVYNSFLSQQLVTTGFISPANAPQTDIIYGGDSWLCDFSYKNISRSYFVFEEANYETKNSAFKIVHRFICESNSNVNLRFEDFTQDTKYFPKTPLTDFLNLADAVPFDFYDVEQNNFKYNKDYTSVNDLVTTTVYNPFTVVVNKFPFRTIRSRINKAEGLTYSWKSFLANEYYESVKNRGEITNVQGFNNNLIIHHADSVFITRGREQFQGVDANIQVTLGAGDIYDLPPQELLPDVGYAGTQHQLSCVVTKLGYAFIDAKQGKVFLYSGKLMEISNSGMFNFFEENLKFYINTLVPFNAPINYTYKAILNQFNQVLYYEIEMPVNDIFTPLQAANLTGIPSLEFSPENIYLFYNPLIFNVFGRKGISQDAGYYYIEVFNEPLVTTGDCLLLVTDELKDDNPYQNVGYSITYDEEFNRLMLAKCLQGIVTEVVNCIDVPTVSTRQNVFTREVTRTRYVNVVTRGNGNLPVTSTVTPTIEFLEGEPIATRYKYTYEGTISTVVVLDTLQFQVSNSFTSGSIDIYRGNDFFFTLLKGESFTILDPQTTEVFTYIGEMYSAAPNLPNGFRITRREGIFEYWNGSNWFYDSTVRWITFNFIPLPITDYVPDATGFYQESNSIQWSNVGGTWFDTQQVQYYTNANCVTGTADNANYQDTYIETTQYWDGSNWQNCFTEYLVQQCTTSYVELPFTYIDPDDVIGYFDQDLCYEETDIVIENNQLREIKF
jgi:hypothetical protein